MKFKFLLLFIFISFAVYGENDKNKTNVYIGVYLTDISNFNLHEGRFNADLDVWCKWLGTEEIPKINFANAEINLIEEISRENDGNWRSIRYRIQGTFRGNFPLQKFPFDSQNLKIIIETPDKNIKLKPELAGSGMSPEFSITGWLYKPYFKASIQKNKYYSDFGSIEDEGNPVETEAVIFSLDLTRPILPYLIKFLIPLIIIIGMAYISFFISPDNLEVNASLNVTSLLACIAFHFTQADTLPDVSYLVIADMFFIIAYFIILVSIIETVISFTISKTDMDKAVSLDKKSRIVVASFVFACILLLFFTNIIKFKNNNFNEIITKEDKIKTSKTELTAYVPGLSTLNSSNILKGLIYRGLYYETQTNEKTPFLIEKTPDLTNEFVKFLTDGGAVVRWQLKSKLKWGDGKKITSDDLIFSLKVTEDNNIKKITKINNKTVDVEFIKRYSYITDKFTVYPKHKLEQIYKKEGNEGINNKMAKSPPPMDGPYILDKFEENNIAVFKANPYFTGKKPYIKKITILAIKDKAKDLKLNPTAEFMLNNQSDISWFLSNSTYLQMKDKPNINLKTELSNTLLLLQPDLSVYPFNDIEFRKILITALDRQSLTVDLNGTEGKISHSLRPENAEDYNNNIIKYEYNRQEARNKTYRYKFKEQIKLIVTKSIKNSPEIIVLNNIKKQLEDAGIPVEIVYSETSTMKLFSLQDHGGLLYISSRSNKNDLEKFLNKTLIDDKVKSLLEKYNNTMFEERKNELSKQIQDFSLKSLSVIPISFTVYRSASNIKLTGWSPKAVEDNIWWNVEYLYFE